MKNMKNYKENKLKFLYYFMTNFKFKNPCKKCLITMICTKDCKEFSKYKYTKDNKEDAVIFFCQITSIILLLISIIELFSTMTIKKNV